MSTTVSIEHIIMYVYHLHLIHDLGVGLVWDYCTLVVSGLGYMFACNQH